MEDTNKLVSLYVSYFMTYRDSPQFCQAGGREFKSRRSRSESKYQTSLNKSLDLIRGFFVSIIIKHIHIYSKNGHKNDGHKISNSLFQTPSSFPTYIKGVPLCVIIEAQILTSFERCCVWGLWFILKINNYGDV